MFEHRLRITEVLSTILSRYPSIAENDVYAVIFNLIHNGKDVIINSDNREKMFVSLIVKVKFTFARIAYSFTLCFWACIK